MIYLVLAMTAVGFVAAPILSWRLFLPLAALIFVAASLSAAVWADHAVFLRGLLAYVAAQVGYVVGGVSSFAWRDHGADREADVERRTRQRNGWPFRSM